MSARPSPDSMVFQIVDEVPEQDEKLILSSADLPEDFQPERQRATQHGYRLKYLVKVNSVRLEPGTVVPVIRVMEPSNKTNRLFPFICWHEDCGVFRLGRGHDLVEMELEDGGDTEGVTTEVEGRHSSGMDRPDIPVSEPS